MCNRGVWNHSCNNPSGYLQQYLHEYIATTSIPEYSMSVLDIQYKNQNGEYPTKQVDNTEVPVEITKAGKYIFFFPKREITELQIKVKQPYWFRHDNKRVFMYGFQDIIVENREYSQNTAEFVTKFSLEGTDRRSLM
ncbi:hypothetical protein LAV79_01335 [Peribacillus butanolivorans]|uniref:hypothetical protein n=1 Tax=Peribacillus butanolivorans TaxID=421767 RepID=UPI0030C90ED2